MKTDITACRDPDALGQITP